MLKYFFSLRSYVTQHAADVHLHIFGLSEYVIENTSL
jgi:hypothetical protein